MGQGVEEPKIAITGLRLTAANMQLMGAKKNTWKITTDSNLSMIKFGRSEEEFNNLIEPYGSVTIDLVGTCEINDWNDAPQINIIDYNIVKRVQFDF